MTKTNAMRILDKAGVAYTAQSYTAAQEGRALGVAAAKELGLPPEQVFKTLVAAGDKRGVCVFCIPVHAQLDLKQAAAASGNKKLTMIAQDDLRRVTGYERGACCPVGMKKPYPTYIAHSALDFAQVGISAGVKGGELLLDPRALGRLVGARFCPLTESGGSDDAGTE